MPSARRFGQTVPKVRPVSSATLASGRVPRRASSSFVHSLGLRFKGYADRCFVVHAAILHAKSAGLPDQNVGVWRSFFKRMLLIKFALRQHRVADEPPA